MRTLAYVTVVLMLAGFVFGCGKEGPSSLQESVKKIEDVGGKASEAAGKAARQAAETGVVFRIRAAIGAEKDLAGLQIEIENDDGVVTLTGAVPDRKAMMDLGRTVKKVKGVTRVINKTRIAPPATQPAS